MNKLFKKIVEENISLCEEFKEIKRVVRLSQLLTSNFEQCEKAKKLACEIINIEILEAECCEEDTKELKELLAYYS